MKNKGFTLIELLAVIVILAIIALIAVPIVLNIINDAKDQSIERSAELYEKAVQNAIMKIQLDGKTIVPDGEYTVQENGSICIVKSGECKEETTLQVEVEGERPEPTDSKIVLKDGKITDYTLKISGITKSKYKYGYMWYTGTHVYGPRINGDGSSLETTLPEDKTYYLKFKLDDSNKVTNAYACVKFNRTTERCLEGGSGDTYGWETSKTDSTGRVAKLYAIEQERISEVVVCDFQIDTSFCTDYSFTLAANNYDRISSAETGIGYCSILETDYSFCASS